LEFNQSEERNQSQV